MASQQFNSAADTATEAAVIRGRGVFAYAIEGTWNSPLSVQFRVPGTATWTTFKSLAGTAAERLGYQEFTGIVEFRLAMAEADFAPADNFTVVTGVEPVL